MTPGAAAGATTPDNADDATSTPRVGAGRVGGRCSLRTAGRARLDDCGKGAGGRARWGMEGGGGAAPVVGRAVCAATVSAVRVCRDGSSTSFAQCRPPSYPHLPAPSSFNTLAAAHRAGAVVVVAHAARTARGRRRTGARGGGPASDVLRRAREHIHPRRPHPTRAPRRRRTLRGDSQRRQRGGWFRWGQRHPRRSSRPPPTPLAYPHPPHPPAPSGPPPKVQPSGRQKLVGEGPTRGAAREAPPPPPHSLLLPHSCEGGVEAVQRYSRVQAEACDRGWRPTPPAPLQSNPWSEPAPAVVP